MTICFRSIEDNSDIWEDVLRDILKFGCIFFQELEKSKMLKKKENEYLQSKDVSNFKSLKGWADNKFCSLSLEHCILYYKAKYGVLFA